MTKRWTPTPDQMELLRMLASGHTIYAHLPGENRVAARAGKSRSKRSLTLGEFIEGATFWVDPPVETA